MSGRARKAKGTAYENKLVLFLRDAGYGAYRVPLSGALGHNQAAAKNLPKNLVRALSGDVGCEVRPGIYLPFEVKFRQEAAGFVTLYNHMEQDEFATREYDDCFVFPESDLSFLKFLTDDKPFGSVPMNGPAINKVMAGFFTDPEILALKAKDRPWLFVLRKQDIPQLKEGIHDS